MSRIARTVVSIALNKARSTAPDNRVAPKLDNVRFFPRAFRKARTTHSPKTLTRWWLRVLKKYPNLQIELTGSLDPAWPTGPTEVCLRNYGVAFDGRCIRITFWDENGGELKLARARLYELSAGSRTFYILGDAQISEPLLGRPLYPLLVAFRVLLCWLLDIPPSQIIWPAGRMARLAKLFGFVDVPPCALKGAPEAVVEIGLRSKSECPELLTGLMRLADKKVPLHLQLITKSVVNNCIKLDGEPSVLIGLGPILENMFGLMLQKIQEERAKVANDGSGDGC